MPTGQLKNSSKENSTEEPQEHGAPAHMDRSLTAGRDERLKRPLKSNRSGGPRTSEGRARSSLNAIKHGGYVTAKSASVAYQALRDELTIRISPIGAAEEGIVESLALELYSLTMLGRLEVERLQAATSAEVNLIELAQTLSYPWTRTHLEALRSPPSPSVLTARLLDFFEGHLHELEGQKAAGLSRADQLTVSAVGFFIDDLKNERLEGSQEPDYLECLDRHVLTLGTGHAMLADSMALAVDLHHLVDYWLFRNSHRIEATRRELQVGQMVRTLTDQHVGRARDLAHRHVQQCIELLELLQASPVDLGGKRIRRAQPSGE